MTKEMILFCEKNFTSIIYNTIVSTDTEVISLKKPMDMHLNLLEDVRLDLPSSFLIYKYFNENVWLEEDIYDNGEYKFLPINIFNKLQINLHDGGMILVRKYLTKKETEIWTKDSELLSRMNELFVLEIEDVQDIIDYYINKYKVDFKKKKNELIKIFKEENNEN